MANNENSLPDDGEKRKRKSADNAARKVEKPNFLRLADEVLQNTENSRTDTGRPRLLVRDVIFALIYKAYLNCSAKTVIPFLEEPRDLNYISHIPHSNTLLNYLRWEELTAVLEDLVGATSLPMKILETHYAIDSTPHKCHQFHLEKDRKTGRLVEKRSRVRLHIICGVSSGVVTAAKATSRFDAEQRYFELLLRRTAALGFKMEGIAGDKNYLSQKSMALAHEMDMKAFLTFKKDSTTRGKKSPLWIENLEKFRGKDEAVMKFYRQRNMVEATHSAIKRRFGVLS